MPTAFIDNQVVVLPRKVTPGAIMSEIDAAIISEIQHNRVKARLRYLLSRGEIDANGIQVKANELMDLPLSPNATLDDSEETDPVLEEAMTIAREIVTKRMASEGLPVPKNLDLHAKALVDAIPALQEKARRRIEARLTVAKSLMEGIS